VFDPRLHGSTASYATIALAVRCVGGDILTHALRFQVTLAADNKLTFKSLEATSRSNTGGITSNSSDPNTANASAAPLPLGQSTASARAAASAGGAVGLTQSERIREAKAAFARELGVSQAIVENVMFCHQEDSAWPLGDDSGLKERFDKIFAADRFNRGLECLRDEVRSQCLYTPPYIR